MQLKNYRGWDRGDWKHSRSPQILYPSFPLHAPTAHVTALRQELPRAPRSLQPSPAEAFARCCYAYTRSQRLGLRTADTSLPSPPAACPYFSPSAPGPRGKLFLSRHTQPAPAAGAAARGAHGPFKFQLCGGGQHRWRRGAGLGPGPAAGARRWGARNLRPGEVAAPAPRSLAVAERMRVASGCFFCLLEMISIVT